MPDDRPPNPAPGSTPTQETRDPNLSTDTQGKGDAMKPSDTLDRDRPPADETIPRKSSLT
jgi:hypothetical protein